MRFVGSAPLGAIVAALVDLGVALARGGLPGAHAPAYLGAAVGFYGAAAFALALAASALVSGLPRPWPRPTPAGVLGTAAAAAIFAGTIFFLQRRVVANFSNPTYAATAMALLGLAALALFVAARPPLVRLARRRAGQLALGLFAAVGLAAVAAVLSRVEWRVLRLGGVAGAGVLIGALAAVVALVRPPRWLAPAGTAGCAALIAWSAARLPAEAAAAAADSGLALGPLIAAARRAADRDGDGFSSAFAGGDCDDRRRDVHPAARDVPGNGVDENCAGGDAKPRVAAAQKKAGDWTRVDNLLLVTIDSLRADRVRPDLTPRLLELAARGVRFSRVWAQAPNTPRSFPSVITSRYPSQVAWAQQYKNYSPLLDDDETVFEALSRAGVRTIGLFSHCYFAAERNLGQGFAEWDNTGAKTIAESNTDVAAPRIGARVTDRLRKLAASRERFALWTHFFEPHGRYMDHADFPVTLRGIPGLVARYDGEVRFVDRHFGALLDVLRETGLQKNTAVVVFSDHGEAFGEHRHYFHGQSLHEEQLRVPMVVAAPALAPRAAADPVALIDLAPTLCDLLGVTPPPAFRGRSLLPLLRGRPLPGRPVYAELLPAPSWPHAARALVDGDRKIIDRVSDGVVEVYDLASDPTERRNLAAARPEVGRDGRAALLRFVDSDLDGS